MVKMHLIDITIILILLILVIFNVPFINEV